jgi:prevent-host-death family protein
MTTITTVKARSEFADLINRAAYGKQRIALSRRGKKVAAIVPIEDLSRLRELEDRADIEDAKKALREPGGVTLDELRKELGIK